MENKRARPETGVYTMAEFQAEPDAIVDKSIERGEVVLQNDRGEPAIVISTLAPDDE